MVGGFVRSYGGGQFLAQSVSCGDEYATRIVASSPQGEPGSNDGGRDVLGPPDNNTTNFDDDGQRHGYVTVGFDPALTIIDGPGDDFSIYLKDFTTQEPWESFFVLVSEDGTQFTRLNRRFVPSNPNRDEREQRKIDLAGTGIARVTQIKVLNDTLDQSTVFEGPDIDAFRALNFDCASTSSAGASTSFTSSTPPGSSSVPLTSSAANACRPVPVCGDRIIAGGEECDDGNIVNGDCCSGNCRTEAGCSCQLVDASSSAGGGVSSGGGGGAGGSGASNNSASGGGGSISSAGSGGSSGASSSCEYLPQLQDFSDDGSRMVFQDGYTGVDEEDQVYLVTAGSWQIRKLTDPAGVNGMPVGGGYPSISGDGTVVAFTGIPHPGDRPVLMLLNLTTNIYKEVPNLEGGSIIDRNGRFLLVSSASHCLDVYDDQTGTMTNIICALSIQEAFAVNNGTTVFYVAREGLYPATQTVLYKYTIAGGVSRIGLFNGYYLRANADGTTMFYAEGDGPRTMYKGSADLQTLAQQIGPRDDGGLYIFSTTNNGKLVSLMGGPGQHVLVLDDQGNTVDDEGYLNQVGAYSPLSPNGQYLSFTDKAAGGNGWDLFVRDLSSREKIKISRPAGTCQ